MKNQLVIISLVSFLGQFSLASNFMMGESFLTEQLKISKLKAEKNYKKMQEGGGETPKCADFSGNWKGQCRKITPEKDETKEAQISIQQKGCIGIEFKTKGEDATVTESEVFVGAVSSASTSALVGVHAMSYSKWSENATTLLQNIKVLTNIVFGDVPQIIEFDIPQATYIENNQLKTKVQGMGLSLDCTFDKVK